MDDPVPTLRRRPGLLALGFTDGELQRMRRRGELVSVRRGAYLTGPLPEAPAERHRLDARAALDQLSPGAVLSHASAAVWHGLPTWRVPLTRVQVVRARSSGGRVHRRVHVLTGPLSSEEILLVDGLPVTSVARTVVDLARTVSFESGVVTADAALAAGVVTMDDLELALARCKGWPGCPRARRVVAFADGRAESVGESRSRVAIARAGLPAPLPQWVVCDAAGRFLGKVDFGWPDRRTVAEFDGLVKYGRALNPDQPVEEVLVEEKLREDRLRAEGLTVVRWTWRDLPTFTPTATRLLQALSHPRPYTAFGPRTHVPTRVSRSKPVYEP